MSQEALKPSFKLLKNRSELVGAEIGVYEGINAKYYLKELDIKCVFLIEPYTAYENYDLKNLGLRKTLEIAEKIAHATLGSYDHKIRWIKKKSVDAVNFFFDEILDFVYIVGNHSYASVAEDILLYYPKLKEGGLLAANDYDIKSVKRAVDEFAEIRALDLHIKDTGELRGKEKYD